MIQKFRVVLYVVCVVVVVILLRFYCYDMPQVVYLF